LVVTPVKTGVQEVLKVLKILLASTRNDGKRTQPNFFTPSGLRGGLLPFPHYLSDCTYLRIQWLVALEMESYRPKGLTIAYKP